MIEPIRCSVGLVLAVLAYILFTGHQALACACCTNEGQRNVATVALDSGKRQEIESLRFGDKATLFTGEGDADGIEGIATPAGTYRLSAKWLEDRLVLFRDTNGHTGTLSLVRPGTVSVFEVDPRDRPDKGHQGPRLYKEWKLSAPASGSGVFQPGIAPRQILTLILLGGGNSCTSGIDFSHWTLVMQGPKANYTLFGDLVR